MFNWLIMRPKLSATPAFFCGEEKATVKINDVVSRKKRSKNFFLIASSSEQGFCDFYVFTSIFRGGLI